MSNKLVQLTDEQKKQQEDERFLQGRPNRMEVAQYVNGLLEDKYMPEIQQTNYNIQQAMTLGFMVLQSILIEKGIATGEEIEARTKEFIEQQKKDLEEKQKSSENDSDVQ